jgi:hypothetical protein
VKKISLKKLQKIKNKNKDTKTMDNIIPDYINKNFIKNILKDLVEEDCGEEELIENVFLKDKNIKKFKFDLYNDTTIFKYLENIYLINNNNSCWLDCFIILYIFIFRKYLTDILNNEDIDNNNLFLLNEFVNFIIQSL